MNGLEFPVLHDKYFYCYILCVTFCQFVRPYYLQFTNFVSWIYLKPQNNEINLQNNYYTNIFWLCNVCMYVIILKTICMSLTQHMGVETRPQ